MLIRTEKSIRLRNQLPRWPFCLNTDSYMTSDAFGVYSPAGGGAGKPIDLTNRSVLVPNASYPGHITSAPGEFNGPALRLDAALMGLNIESRAYTPVTITAPYSMSIWSYTTSAGISGGKSSAYWTYYTGGTTYHRAKGIQSFGGGTPFTYNQWTHIVITNDNTALGCKLYRNGVKWGNSLTTVDGTPGISCIHNQSNGSAYTHQGFHIHVEVLTRSMTEEEILLRYDPATRWDMYYELGRRSYFLAGAAPPAGTTGILRQQTDSISRGFSAVTASQLNGVLVS